MSTVDGKHLKLLALHAAHPAGNVVGVTVAERGDWVVELCQPGLALRKLVQLAECDPTLVLTLVANKKTPNEIPDDRHGEHGHSDAIQQKPNLREPRAPGKIATLVRRVWSLWMLAH